METYSHDGDFPTKEKAVILDLNDNVLLPAQSITSIFVTANFEQRIKQGLLFSDESTVHQNNYCC